MEQFWLRDDNAGVIFLMTVDSVKPRRCSKQCRSVGRTLLTFELMPVGPLTPLGMPMKQADKKAAA
jgi:hypothetical protein